jgi:ribosomal protein S19E (S16A)
MIKHIGKHGDRKVAIAFREIPGEEHMALVVYPETMPVQMHDTLMKVIESEIGQTADSLGDALFRSLFPDGRPMLQTLHSEGMLKKVQTKQIVVTPNPRSHVNLEEMNNILRKMKLGESAIREMADLDKNRGMSNYKRKDDYGREIGAPVDRLRGSEVAGSDAARALDDAALANNFRDQATRMAAEAKSLLAESARLMKEAQAMSGEPVESAPVAETTTRRGRPPKTKAAVDATL